VSTAGRAPATRRVPARLAAAARGLGVLLAVAFCLGPFLWQVMTSLKPPAEVFAVPPTWWPSEVSFESYRQVFTGRPFARYVWNSLLVAAATTALTLALAVPAAYALSRLRLPGRRLLYQAILIASLVPAVVLLVPLYEMARWAGAFNRPLALAVPYAAINLPLAVWALASFFRAVPRELEDAAAVDGFSRWATLWRVVLPLALPGVATTAILVFVFAWNEFLIALSFMTRPETYTAPVGVALLSGASVYEVPWGQISAAVVLTTLPLVVVVLLFQRRIAAGLTAGALKG
jgi:multiple sugar transport system permease protein